MPQQIGRYKITGEIGSGGFGHVYSGLDPAVRRTVAIKVLNAPGDRDLAKRFRAEAQTVANLLHKNIVTVHEFGEENGDPYLVMEYLEGTTVQDLIRQRVPLSLQEKLWIMSEVAEGLQCAHDRGVIHRDVKPANIMRLSDGSVKIMDFGISRLAREGSTRLTQSGMLIGTLLYMAPEQFSGTADAMSDIFSYGVTFYELLTGRHPFPGGDPAVVINQIMNAEPKALRSLFPECPESVERIVNRTLAKSREARYSSLVDVVVDTRPILVDLRRQQAGELFSRADELLRGDQLDAAQSAIRKVLDLDPWHTEARQLRSRIEDAIHRRDLAGRAGALLDRAENGLSRREFQEAEECLATVRKMSLSDAGINARLERAYSQIEEGRKAQRLLDAAREDLQKDNLTDAFRAVSQALASNPGDSTGQQLLQEIRMRMASREAQRRIQEEIGRAESLLSIGEIDEALALLAKVESQDPSNQELPVLRARAAAQRAEAERARRLAEGTAAVRALLKNRQFEEALGKIDGLLADFPGNPELMAFRRHAAEQIAVQKRAEEIRELKTEAAVRIEMGEYDHAIHALEAGAAFLGDDADFTRLLQAAVAKKAWHERERAVARIIEDTERLRRQGKLDDDALRAIERVIQPLGNDPRLQRLLREVSDELREKAPGHPFVDALRKSRSVWINAVLEEVRRLAGEKRWEEAVRLIDKGLAEFPNEPSLISERATVVAAIEVPVTPPGRLGLLPLLASIWNRVAMWATIPGLTVVAGIVLIFGFWSFQRFHDRSLQMQVLVQKAIQDRNWIDAEKEIDEYAKAKPQNDPRVVEMWQQVEQGKHSELTSLQEAIPRDIAARQWPQAASSLARFQELSPADPRAADWLKQVKAGLALDQELSDLRSSILDAIQAKDWTKADARITSLLAKMPDYPHAAELRALVAQGRKADLQSNDPLKRQKQEQMDLARAEQLFQQGDYAAAIELFRSVSTQDPSNARARSGLKRAMDAKATEDRVFGRGH